MSNGETAYYLYCLTPGGRDIRVSAIGVDGRRPVWVHACGEIAAALSEVDVAEFCGESAEARLRDLAWLGPLVGRHEAVIEELMSRAPVLPARLATLFTSVDSLQQSVLAHREAVTGFFAQLGDQQEWAVQGLLDRAGALRGLVASVQPAEATAATSPGARYFEEKRIQTRCERDLNLRLKEYCRRAAAVLGTESGGFRERRVPGAGAAGSDAEVVLNWAFLVSPAALMDFRRRLDQFNGADGFPGLTLTVTGPWPPYSFAPDLSAGGKP
jgi:hypothetical protein